MRLFPAPMRATGFRASSNKWRGRIPFAARASFSEPVSANASLLRGVVSLMTNSIFVGTTNFLRSSSGFDLPLQMRGLSIFYPISSNRISTRRRSATLGLMTRLIWTCQTAFFGGR